MIKKAEAALTTAQEADAKVAADAEATVAAAAKDVAGIQFLFYIRRA